MNSSITYVYMPLALLIAVVLIAVAYVWYKLPRWIATRNTLIESEITAAEDRVRQIFTQLVSIPTIMIGVITAVVAILSSIQGYREAIRNGARQDQLQQSQQDLQFNQVLRDSLAMLGGKTTHAAGAYSLHQLLEAEQPVNGASSPRQKNRREIVRRALEVDMDRAIADEGFTNLAGQRCGADPDTSSLTFIDIPVTDDVSVAASALLIRDVDIEQGISLACGRFRGIYLPYGTIMNSDLSSADLSGSDLYLATFTNSMLTKTNFNGANLTGTDLSQTGPRIIDRLSNTTFCPGKNYGAPELNKYSAKIPAQLGAAQMDGACGEKTSFMGAMLDNAAMRHVQFEFANFRFTQLTRADLRGAAMARSDFQHADLSEARFSPDGIVGSGTPSLLWSIEFSDAVLARSDFSFAKIYRSTFDRADLTDANFSFADIVEPSFNQAILLRTSFVGTGITPQFLHEQGAILCATKFDARLHYDGHWDQCGSILLKVGQIFNRIAPVPEGELCVSEKYGKFSSHSGEECKLKLRLSNCMISSEHKQAFVGEFDPSTKCLLTSAGNLQ